jgi:hypothetical protein
MEDSEPHTSTGVLNFITLLGSDTSLDQRNQETRLFVYYETINREINKRLTYECRCNERLKVKTEGSTCLRHGQITEGELLNL